METAEEALRARVTERIPDPPPPSKGVEEWIQSIFRARSYLIRNRKALDVEGCLVAGSEALLFSEELATVLFMLFSFGPNSAMADDFPPEEVIKVAQENYRANRERSMQ